MPEPTAEIAQVFEDHQPANTAGMAGHARPHFWGCACQTFGHGKRGHRQHLIDTLASVFSAGETHAEWGLIIITRDGKTLLPEAEICTTREQAEERARQERTFGMTVIVASRQVTAWEPVEAGEIDA